MYKYDLSIKSGTGGWFDEDGCDSCIAELETDFIPRIGETIQIDNNNVYKKYLIRDVEYWYRSKERNGITVYVIPIS